MNRLLAALLVALALPLPIAVLDAAPAGACDCSTRTDAEAFAYADAVFVGRVTGYEATDAARWTFAVRHVYKGSVAETQPIVSEISGASCGLEIPHQGEFLVFASYRTNVFSATPTRPFLQASSCGGTRLRAARLFDPAIAGTRAPTSRAGPARELQARAEIGPSSHDANVTLIAGAAVGFALGTGIALVVLRRRRKASGATP